MKKLYAIIVLILTIASITACSGKNNTDTSEGSKGVENQTETGEKKKVTVWAWDTEFNIAALEIAKEIYQADHPDVEIEIVEVGQNDVIQKLNTGLGSGSLKGLPNIIPIEDYRIQTFLKSYPGSFIDMTDKINYADFADYKQGPMTLDGKQYGIPWDSGAAVMYYRKDLIEQAGYTEEDMQDLTWSEFIEIGKVVKEKTGKNTISMDPNDIELMKLTLQSAGTWYTKEDGVTPFIQDNAALEECLNIINKLIDSDIVRTYSGWAGLLEGIHNSEVAFQIKGAWFTPSVMKGPDQEGLWRITKVPRLETVEGATNASNLGGGSWYILDNVENSDIAVDFMVSTFGENTELYNRLLEEKGIIGTYLPSLESATYDKEVPFFGNQQIYRFIADVNKEIPKVNYGIYTYAYQDVIMAEIQNMLSGTSVEDVLKSGQVQAEAQAQ